MPGFHYSVGDLSKRNHYCYFVVTGVNSDNRFRVCLVGSDTRRSTLSDSCPVFFRLRPLSVDHPTASQILRLKSIHTDGQWQASGVTRVGVTRGGNTDGCHPIFSWKKNLTTFLVIASESMIIFFICRPLTTPIYPSPSPLVTPLGQTQTAEIRTIT